MATIKITLPEGQVEQVPKGTTPLEVLRKLNARLAAAVLELFPDVKLGVGPPTDNGFFYEFFREQPFTPDDLAKIEKKMGELRDADIPNQRKFLPRAEAMRLYEQQKQTFKCELVTEKAEGDQVSFYVTGKFIDFCRGPHIPSTGRIKAFKILSVEGMCGPRQK